MSDVVPVASRSWPACQCDFCTGKKRWADNWCPCCGKVVMALPKWWENLDVCEACEQVMAAELESAADQDLAGGER